jgi:hypothetical protein
MKAEKRCFPFSFAVPPEALFNGGRCVPSAFGARRWGLSYILTRARARNPRGTSKFEIRSTKFETNSKSEIRMFKTGLFRLPQDGGEDPHQLAAFLDQTVALGV